MADTEEDDLAEARDAFERHVEAWAENHADGLDDLKFARLGEQWPDGIAKQRTDEGRPMLTINKLPAFIRQVVNDTRQNKPAIKVRPADSGADVETADIYSGLIRNIEYTSNADVAYDTAAENAVTCGFGYFRIGLDYAFDDAFDLDIAIERITNPFSVLPDPMSTAADSSDWNSAFVIDSLDRKAFERQYKGAEPIDWDTSYAGLGGPWLEGETVLIAEYWTREEYTRHLVLLQSGTVLGQDQIDASPDLQAMLEAGVDPIVRERDAKCWRVRQRMMTGAEVLSDKVWPGRYIPIVPVWGDEVDVEGKRHFRSLIRDAKDAQRMYNYWRSTATELVALAPRVPFIGPAGFADADPEKWATINQASIPYVEFTVNNAAPNAGAPQRQPMDTGPAAGALQEALNANDDIKATTGLYDASLGARSNETSGKAIMARQREGDVSTFHFTDNLSRAIRHAGRILIDLIPHVYTGQRIVRVIGEDGEAQTKQLGAASGPQQPAPQPGAPQQPPGAPQPQPGQNGPLEQLPRVYDLTAGKYDLTVQAGPSFTTRREEAATQMTELMRSFPAAATVVGPELAKNLDWPGADRIAQKLEALAPQPQGAGAIPPQVQQMIEQGKQAMQQLQAQLQQAQAENQQLKADHSIDAAKVAVDRQKVAVDQYKAETDRMQAQAPIVQAAQPPAPTYPRSPAAPF